MAKKKGSSETNSGGNQSGFSPKPQKSGRLGAKKPASKSAGAGSETNSGGNQSGF